MRTERPLPRPRSSATPSPGRFAEGGGESGPSGSPLPTRNECLGEGLGERSGRGNTLSLADFQRHDPTGGRGGRWLCPLPACDGHTNPRRHRSVSMRDTDGLWNCKRCGGRGKLTDFWQPFTPKSRQEREAEKEARRRVSLTRALERTARRLPLPAAQRPCNAASLPSPTPSPEEGGGESITAGEPSGSPSPLGEGLGRGRLGTLQPLSEEPAARAYVESRGFRGPDAMSLLHSAGVRYAANFGRRPADAERAAWGGGPAIVFPIRDDAGVLVAGQGRFLSPSASPKALTFGERSAGAFLTPGVLEDLSRGAPVALCEAPFDALSLALAGEPALALCGCSGLPGWLTRRAFGRRFLIAFDADEAGQRAAQEITSELTARGGTVEPLPPPEGTKDWNEALQNQSLSDSGNPLLLGGRGACPKGILVRDAYHQQIRPFVLAGSSVPPLDEWVQLQSEPWTMKEEAALDDFIAWRRRVSR